MEITDSGVVKAQVEKVMKENGSISNTSGQGKDAVVPEGVAGWSWGAFLLNFIWSINNKVWIGLLSVIPYAGFVVMFILGLKGREWAWQARHWDSIEEFNRIQAKWSYWGIVSSAVGLLIIILVMIIAGNYILGNLS